MQNTLAVGRECSTTLRKTFVLLVGKIQANQKALIIVVECSASLRKLLASIREKGEASLLKIQTDYCWRIMSGGAPN